MREFLEQTRWSRTQFEAGNAHLEWAVRERPIESFGRLAAHYFWAIAPIIATGIFVVAFKH